MPNLSGKNVLVTGGAGFIGSHLVDKLTTEKVRKIVVIDNFFLGKLSNLKEAKDHFDNLLILRHDAEDYDFMKATLKKHKIDIVFNLATKCLPYSFVNPEETFMVNVNIAKTLLQLLRKKYYKTLIHFSSSEAYGSAKTQNIKEDNPLDPNTPYAAGKAAADLMVMSYLKIYDLDVSIVRPFNTYGPRQNEGVYAAVIPITIKRIIQGKKPILESDGNQTRDFIYVDDVTRATVDIYKNQKTRGKIINIASGKETKIKTIISLITKILKYKGKILHKPERKGDVRRHCANIGLAKSLIGFKPTIDLNKGLRYTINWYLNNSKS